MIKQLIFSYPAEKWIQGKLFVFLIMIISLVVFYQTMWSQLPGKILTIIALIGSLDTLYEIYISWKLAPKRIIIEGNILIGEYASDQRTEISLKSIDRIVVKKSTWTWKHQNSTRVISTQENKELLIDVYLQWPTNLINVIKAANPYCLITSSWFQNH